MKKNIFLEKLYNELEIESVDQLTLNTILIDLAEWDSLSVLILISFVENEFGLNLNSEEIESLITVKDLANKLQLKY